MSAYLLWASTSGDQLQDDVSRLALGGLLPADEIQSSADNEDEVLDDAKAGDTWPGDHAQWWAFLDDVRVG